MEKIEGVKIIKGATVYSPEYLGEQDVLIIADKIVLLEERIDFRVKGIETEIIDGKNKILVPGFIDGHVHIIGGGGEGGYSTRTPEIQLSQITRYGVTTLVGLLGTDGTTRHMESLLAKARGLEEEGITTYIFTGSYQLPARCLTDSSRSDIILIDKIIGIGEIALSDHRSSNPTIEEIAKLTKEARVGGMLSGKAGIIHLHLGDGQDGINYLFDLVKNTDIPVTQFHPTHVNRNERLLKQAIEFAKLGGVVDITSSIAPLKHGDAEIKASEAVKIMLENNVDIKNITMSSDSNGSSPIFDESGNMISIGIGSMETNITELRDMVKEEKIPLDKALRVLTSNVATNLKIKSKKGFIKAGLDADLVLLNNDFKIITVIAKGKVMIRDGDVVIKGRFE